MAQKKPNYWNSFLKSSYPFFSFFDLVHNIEIQRQRDRQMELSNRAHVQFQEESIEDKEKSKYSVEASREMSR